MIQPPRIFTPPNSNKHPPLYDTLLPISTNASNITDTDTVIPASVNLSQRDEEEQSQPAEHISEIHSDTTAKNDDDTKVPATKANLDISFLLNHPKKVADDSPGNTELLLGSIVGKEWIVDRKIASGSFGTLFVGRNIHTKELVAVKAERKDSIFPQLHRERKFYQMLNNGQGIPQMFFYGECSTGHRFHILVMDLLGPNIEDLLQACGGTFSLKTTCMVACQLLSRMEYIHSKGILYRDIKSENFLIGRRNENVLHVVDFGLSKEYINVVSRQHIPFNVKKGSVGTPRYMSINALQHHEQGRRDDLEALSYLFLYLYLGQLPWQGLPGSTFAEKCKRILEKKLKLSIDDICQDAPVEFARFMKYARNLEYEAKPDYTFCRQLFMEVLRKEKLEFDNVYDWTNGITEFWREKNKLLDNLPALPDDIADRVRVTEQNNIRANGKTKKPRKKSSTNPGCCPCCSSLRAKISGFTRKSSNIDLY